MARPKKSTARNAGLTHLDAAQRPTMVDVGDKAVTARTATAEARLKLPLKVARALAARPQLLLADEPTASLDSRTGREVVELLKGLAKDQCCGVLMVTHDPRILDVADRLVQMEDGQLSKGAFAIE